MKLNLDISLELTNQLLFSASESYNSYGSSQSTIAHPISSLPDSVEGGKSEVNELLSLPSSYESALKVNQALQRRITISLSKLTKALQENQKQQVITIYVICNFLSFLLFQEHLKNEIEDQNLSAIYDKTINSSKDAANVRPSSFSIPYFKDKTGIPAPMNEYSKLKVDQGYLDLYTTKARICK